MKAKAKHGVAGRVPSVPKVADVPSAWPRVKLGEIGTIVRGNGIKRSDTRQTGNPCLRYGEIYTSYEFVLDKPKSFVSADVFDRSPHIKKGDLVFTLTGETEDEIAKTLAYLGDEEIAAGGDLAVWSNHGCDPKFLAYLMYSPELIKAKALASNGQIIVHISVKKFQQIDIPLPPLPVQREIVARLERELGAVDKLAKKFEELEAAAEAEFKAELKETFDGLGGNGTGNGAANAPAGVSGARGGVPVVPQVADVSSSTRWVKLGEVCAVGYGYTAKARPTSDNQPRYLRITDIQHDVVDWASVPCCECNDLESFQLHVGDIVFARTGATTGKSFLLQGAFPLAVFASYLIRVVIADKAALLPTYLKYYFETPAYWAAIQLGMAGAAQGGFNSKKLAALQIPLPPLAVQRTIVSRLDAAKEKKEALVAAAKRGRETVALWRKAILKEAFE